MHKLGVEVGDSNTVSINCPVNNFVVAFNANESNKNGAVFKNARSIESGTKRNNLLDTLPTKQTAQIDGNTSSLNDVASGLFAKKEFVLLDTTKESEILVECKTKSLNDNSVKTNSILNSNCFHSSEIYVSCRFCKKGFQTLDIFHIHDCSNKEENDFSSKMHKCQFCSLTFTQKQQLNTHVKGHERNNCAMCNAQFTERKAFCKHLRTEHNIVEPEKLYHCLFCSKHFRKRLSLNLHLKSHVDDQYFCSPCGFTCYEKDTYNSHMKKHLENSKHECHLCQKQFVRRQQYDQHMIAHEKHSCSPCNISFSTKKLFLKHQQSVHHTQNVKKHTCPICKKSFVRPKHLEVHQRVHTGEKPVKCSHCEKNFYDDKCLIKHMKTVRHLQRVNIDEGKIVEIEKRYLCSECGIRFYRQQSLLRHVEIIHSTTESLKCPHCHYRTKCKTNFKRHIELHTDTKRFICELCGSSFRAMATLKEHHTFVHSENRGFICDTCKKGFKNKSTLQRHMRIHSENRPYKCHCNRDYKRMSHLKRHMASAHHMSLKKNQLPIISDSADALMKSLDESSCDDFSVSSASNNDTACIELSNLNINGNTCEEQLSVPSEADSNIAVSLNVIQMLSDRYDTHILFDNSKNTLLTYDSIPCEKAPSSVCRLPDKQTSAENVNALMKSLEALPDESSCDDFSILVVSNNDAACTDLSNLNGNGKTCEEQLIVPSGGDSNIGVPLNAMQTVPDRYGTNIISGNPKNTLFNYDAITCEKTPSPVCILPESHASAISMDDSNLTLSPNNFCIINLPSSPLSIIPITNETTMKQSIESQDVLSLSSVRNLIRPHSLPNLNSQTESSSIDSFPPFSLHNSNSPPSSHIVPFLLTGDISSPLHITDLNLDQNSSSKELFEESEEDILSLPSYTSVSEFEANCSSDHFINPTRDVELCQINDNNRLKFPDFTTSTCTNTSFSSLTSNANNNLPHNLFSNDSLFLSLDALNSEFVLNF